MNALIRTLFLFMFLVGIQPRLAAQTGKYGTPEQRAAIQTEQMQQELQLSAAQVKPVHALNLKYARRVQTEVIDKKPSQWTAMNQIRKIQSGKDVELEKILSEAQMKAYQKMKWAALQKMLLNPGAGLDDYVH